MQGHFLGARELRSIGWDVGRRTGASMASPADENGCSRRSGTRHPQFNRPALAGAASAAATDWALASGLTLFRASIPLIIGTMGGLANMMELSISAMDTDADASAAAAPLRMEGFITKPSLDFASRASAGAKELAIQRRPYLLLC